MDEEEKLLKLYEVHNSRANLLQANLHTYIKFHMGLNVAVIGGTFVLLAQALAKEFEGRWWFIPLLLISSGVSLIFLARNGRRHTVRAHKSWLINLTMVAKLENALGLDAKDWVSAKNADQRKLHLKWGDEALTYAGYAESRNNFCSSRKFVKDRLKISTQHAGRLLCASEVVGWLFILSGAITAIFSVCTNWCAFIPRC